MKNTLYYGDNLEVLREHIAAESVDLIYLDPPFNSDQSYNVLFTEQDGRLSGARFAPSRTRGVGTRPPRRPTTRRSKPAAGSRSPCKPSGRRSATTICWPICR